MIRITIVIVLSLLTLVSCSSEPSLQKYFVTNSENKNFVAIDIAPSILNVDKVSLTAEQKAALQSFEKINVLAFKINDKNKSQFDEERAKVTTILKNQKYKQLMKFGSGKEGASVSCVGEDDNIEEFVLFANKKDAGFAVIRVLGKDMNPNNIMTMMTVLEKANVNLDQLKPLQEMFKK